MTALFASIAVRPNALDRQVDALSAHDLLTRPAYELIDPVRAAAAAHLQTTQLYLWAAALALQIAVLVWFWSSGRSAQLRDRLRTVAGNNTFLLRLYFGAAIALIDKVAAFVPLALQYRFFFVMGLNQDLFRTWLAGWLLGTIAAMIVAGLLAAIVLWLADRTHQWYIYTMAAIMAGSLLVAFATPIVAFPGLVPPAPGSRIDRAVHAASALTRVDGPVSVQRVSQRSRIGYSYVTGLGPTLRVVISDTASLSETAGELRFRIVNAFLWAYDNVALQLALVQGAFIVLGAALAVGISDRIGFRRDDDPISRLALLGAIIGLAYVIALPFYNSYSRNLDNAADDRAIAVTHDPAAAIRLQVRRADQALVAVCPDMFTLWFLTPHSSPGPRIASFQGKPDSDSCAKPHP